MRGARVRGEKHSQGELLTVVEVAYVDGAHARRREGTVHVGKLGKGRSQATAPQEEEQLQRCVINWHMAWGSSP